MARTANQDWFERPEARLQASGASPGNANTEIVSPAGDVLLRITNGGMLTPRAVELAAGTRIIRFAGSGLPHIALAGCWWLQWDQYKRVVQVADARGLSVQVALRLLACVPPEWNEMTVVVQARLKVPLMAYCGASAPVIRKNPRLGLNEILTGVDESGISIEQLYIPGLTSPDLRHDSLLVEGYGHLPPEQSRAGYIIRVQS
ncbi:MAG: hypothetical protein NTX28_18110 [Novosphingobium sp.]|nr:hypothetical protein [Novosphingobium sp.]